MQNLSERTSVTPAIGVLIPTYNRSHDLVRTLDHLGAQTYKDFEVVIINDGSTDDTASQIERYRNNAPFPIFFETQKNGGPAAARNRGIALMRTPITVLIGDDTYPAVDFIRLHLGFHQLHPELDSVAVGYTRYSEEHQRVTPFMRWLNSDGVQFAYGELLAGRSASWRHFYTANLSFKTAYLRDNRFDETFKHYGMEDIELGYRLHARCNLQMTFLPEAIANHVHPITFSNICDRSLKVGENIYKFGELWPEHQQPPESGGLVIAFLTSRLMWSPVAALMDLMTRAWFPGRILHAFVTHFRAKGYRHAAETSEIIQR